MTILQRIKHYIKGDHDLVIKGTKYVRGAFSGRSIPAQLYICRQCGKNFGWCVTDSL